MVVLTRRAYDVRVLKYMKGSTWKHSPATTRTTPRVAVAVKRKIAFELEDILVEVAEQLRDSTGIANIFRSLPMKSEYVPQVLTLHNQEL